MIDDTIKKDLETEVKDQEVQTEPEQVKEPDVVDVDLGFVEKKKFRIAGDYNRMLELNVSDLNVLVRLKSGYSKLQKLFEKAQKKVAAIPDAPENATEGLDVIADTLKEIDDEMRSIVDEIFDANVSQTVAPSGNMFDPVGGQYRFERVLDIVTNLYQSGLNAEFKKMKNKVESKANKYTSKYHK